MNKNIERIAYEGLCLEMEWYFDENNCSQALEYYQKLSTDERIKVLKLFKRMGDVGKINDKKNSYMKAIKFTLLSRNQIDFSAFFARAEKLL